LSRARECAKPKSNELGLGRRPARYKETTTLSTTLACFQGQVTVRTGKIIKEKLEAPPGFEPGVEVCRQGRDDYLVDSSCFLVGPTPPSCLVFGRNCSQVVPKFARRSCDTLCNVGGQSVQTVNDAVIQDSIPCAGEVPRAGRRESSSRRSSPRGLCRPVEDERDRLFGAAILVRNGEKPPAAMFRVVHRSSNVRQSMTTTICGSGPTFRRKR
jgi:hypothetical protein